MKRYKQGYHLKCFLHQCGDILEILILTCLTVFSTVFFVVNWILTKLRGLMYYTLNLIKLYKKSISKKFGSKNRLFNVNCLLPCLQSKVDRLLCSVYILLFTVYCILFTVYMFLFKVDSILFLVYCLLYAVYCTVQCICFTFKSLVLSVY